MKALSTPLNDCILIQPDVFKDARGKFLESFNSKVYSDLLPENTSFVQDNFSLSTKNVLRGLHFQEIKPQGKLVSVSHGAVLDVVVDLRRSSSTFCQWYKVELNATNHSQLWIPPGFAHGFLALSDNVHFQYKCTEYYDPSSEQTIIWNDPDLAIEWPKDRKFILSAKDAVGSKIQDLNF
jgi:dTDP-4-dehydrorhamnose 3,5-epimerase